LPHSFSGCAVYVGRNAIKPERFRAGAYGL